MLYRAGDLQEFHLPFRVEDHGNGLRCVPGMPGNGVPPLLNEHKLEQHKYTTVIFCYDITVARQLDLLLEETKRVTPGTYVVTALYGGLRFAEQADLTGLRFKDVIYLPAPNPESYIAATEYNRLLMAAEASSFKVLREPAWRHEPAGFEGEPYAIPDPFLRFLAENY